MAIIRRRIDRHLFMKKEGLQRMLLDAAAEMLRANHGNVFPLDLFMIGILKRTMFLNSGFDLLMSKRNFVSAASLIRLNLDSLLQLHASTLVSNADDFAMKKLAGKQTNNAKDRDGNKMNDGYLVRSLGNQEGFRWIKSVYKETSRFVHFSEKHILISAKEGKDFTFSFEISDEMEIPQEREVEARKAMEQITRGIVLYTKSWTAQKNLRP